LAREERPYNYRVLSVSMWSFMAVRVVHCIAVKF
jgi:hypothetical protein